MYKAWMGRTIGVEMEMTTHTTQRTTLSESMIRAALQGAVPNGRLNSAAASYFHSTGSTWDVKTDSSCGWEVATPALALDETGHNAELRAGCQALAALRPSITSACGLHVHIDCRDFDWADLQRLLKLWVRYEPFIYGMVPASRRDNTYCMPHRSYRWSGETTFQWRRANEAIEATSERAFNRPAQQLERRSGLNISGWWRTRRVEVRLHTGTVDYEKIRRWSMMLVALVNRVKHPTLPMIQSGGYSTRGCSAEYLGKVLGLLATDRCPEVHPEGALVVRWMKMRYEQFDGARSVPARPRPVRPGLSWDVVTGGFDRNVSGPVARGVPIETPAPESGIGRAVDAALSQE